MLERTTPVTHDSTIGSVRTAECSQEHNVTMKSGSISQNKLRDGGQHMQSSGTEAGGFFIIPRIAFVHSGNHTRLQWGFSCLGRMRRRCSAEMASGHEVLPCVVAVSAVWNELTEATEKVCSPLPLAFQTSISVCSLRTLAMTAALLCTKHSLPISTWCRDDWDNKQHLHGNQERIIQISKRTDHSHNPRGDFNQFHSGAQLI